MRESVTVSIKGGTRQCPLVEKRGMWGLWEFSPRNWSVGYIPLGMAAVPGIRNLDDAKAALERVADMFGEACTDLQKADPRLVSKVGQLGRLALQKVPILRKNEAFRIHHPHKCPGHRLNRNNPMQVDRCEVDAAKVLTCDGMAMEVHRWPGEPWRAHVVGSADCAMPSLCTMPGEVGNQLVADPDLIAALDAIPGEQFANGKED